MEPCQHEGIIERLIRMEESNQFATLLQVALPIRDDLERLGDPESLRASVNIRFMMMKALAMTGRSEEAASLWEETAQRYGSHDDYGVLFWVYSAAINTADTYWQLGKHARATEILESCVNRFSSHPQAGLRTLGVRADINLSVCRSEQGHRDVAVSQLTRIIKSHVDDLAIYVNEELCRAVQLRYQFLCGKAQRKA